jgi:surface protein
MFLGCNSLISIPDISNWNVSNANYINSMFSECLSLVLTPNISKWDIKKKNILKGMFGGSFNCLNNLP